VHSDNLQGRFGYSVQPLTTTNCNRHKQLKDYLRPFIVVHCFVLFLLALQCGKDKIEIVKTVLDKPGTPCGLHTVPVNRTKKVCF
jgi:hypothetical protein